MINCICDFKKENEPIDLIKCIKCNNYQHKQCVIDCLKLINHDYICPQCQVDYSEIYINPVKRILSAKKFNQTYKINENNINQEYTFSFNINLFEYNPTKKNRKGFIMIRCLKLGEKYFNLKWPEKLDILINNKFFITLNNGGNNPIIFSQSLFLKNNFQSPNLYYNITNTRFYNIDTYFKDKILNTLTIKITKKDSLDGKQFFSYNYVLSIDFVEMLNEDEIIELIPHKNDKNEILEIVSNNNIESEKVDLFYPEDYIEIPVRGIFCNHFNVLDLKYFLYFWKRNRFYSCSFCKKPVNFLYIDDIFKNILNQYFDKNIQSIKIDNKYNIIETFQIKNLDYENKESEENENYSIKTKSFLSKYDNISEKNHKNDFQNKIFKIEKSYPIKQENFSYNNNNNNNNNNENIEILSNDSSEHDSNSFSYLETYSNITEKSKKILTSTGETSKENKLSNNETGVVPEKEDNYLYFFLNEKNNEETHKKQIFDLVKDKKYKKYCIHNYEIDKKKLTKKFNQIIKNFKGFEFTNIINNYFDFDN